MQTPPRCSARSCAAAYTEPEPEPKPEPKPEPEPEPEPEPKPEPEVVQALDAAFPETPALWPPAGVDAAAVGAAVAAFRATFPRNARPSSRAAFLFE